MCEWMDNKRKNKLPYILLKRKPYYPSMLPAHAESNRLDWTAGVLYRAICQAIIIQVTERPSRVYGNCRYP